MAKKSTSKGKKPSRARAVGRAVFGGYKGTGLAALSGGALYYGSMFASTHSQWLRDHWYGIPGLMVVVGHFAKKKQKLAGPGFAACTIGGYQLAQNYAFYRQQQQQRAAAPQMAAQAAPPQLPPETAMLMNAAARQARQNDAGMLVGRPLRR